MILIYTTPTCAYCIQVKRYLDSKGVPNEYREAIGKGYEDLANKYGFTVPLVLNTDTGNGMVGYDIGKLKKLLEA